MSRDRRHHPAQLAGSLLAGFLLAACNTPYPNGSPIPGARLSANPAPPASRDFCRIYARQTTGNTYENRIDREEDSFGARFIQRQTALRDGSRAYQRCLAGRTN